MRRHQRNAAAFLARPIVLRRFHGWSTVFWIFMTPISFITGLASLTAYVTALSLWALVLTSWGAWQTAIVAKVQDDDADVQDVVDRLDGA